MASEQVDTPRMAQRSDCGWDASERVDTPRMAQRSDCGWDVFLKLYLREEEMQWVQNQLRYREENVITGHK